MPTEETTVKKEDMETTKEEQIPESAHAADVAEFMEAIPGVEFKNDETEAEIEAAADAVEEELKQDAAEVVPTESAEEPTEEVEAKEETPSSEEETSEAPEDEKEEVTAEPSELELVKAQNIKLMAMLNDPDNANGFIAKLTAATPVEQQAETTVPAQVVAAPVPVAPIPVAAAVPIPITLNDETLANVLGDPKTFTEYVASEVQRGRQEVLSEIGPIIQNMLAVRETVSAFFKREENRDLIPLSNAVTQAATMLEKQKPGVSIEELLTESAQLTRESLGLNAHLAGAVALPDGTVKIPKKPTGGVPSAAKRFARGTTRRAPVKSQKDNDAPEPGSTEEQIQQMYATL